MAYASNLEPDALTELTSLAAGDVFVVGDVSDANEVAKFITKTNLLADIFAGPTLTGTVTVSGLTASELVATDGSKGLQSLAVATYPSLTELAYVKGVTSAIQTQLDTKGTLSNVSEDTTPQLGGALDGQGNDLNNMGVLFLTEQAAAEVDVAGKGQLWVKTATPNQLWFTDDAGTDFQLASLAGTETFTNKTLTSPTLTTPALGTPSSGNLGNCTAYPGDSSLTTVGTVTSGNVDAVVSASSTTTAGKIEVATAAEINTGTDAARAVSPDTLAGSNFGIRYLQAIVVDFTTDTATGDGKFYFHVPAAMDGMNLVEVHAEVITAGTTGTTDIQIHNVDNALDMLSTKLTIDSAETGSDTAATAAVINTSNDHVNTNDVVRIDVDAVSTTAAKGLIVTMGFQLP